MNLRMLTEHRSMSALIGITLVLMLVVAIIIQLNYGRLSELIVLHFDALHGIDMFGTRIGIWGVWWLGLTIQCVNGILAYEYYHRERLLSFLFLGANVLVAILTLIIVGVLITTN
jgi:hypothetical protein